MSVQIYWVYMQIFLQVFRKKITEPAYEILVAFAFASSQGKPLQMQSLAITQNLGF